MRGSRSSLQIVEQEVSARVGEAPGHLARPVFLIAEDDRVSRTGLLACGNDVSVANVSISLLRLDPSFVDALDAVRALLHNAAPSDGDVRVVQHSEERNPRLVVDPD